MRVEPETRLKALLLNILLSRPARRFSRWLHDGTDTNSSTPAPARVCFVHIPKTGGTFVAQSENREGAIISPMQNLNHSTVVDPDWELLHDVPPPFGEANAVPLSELDGRVVFSNVRNIFSFFVSYFHHAAGHVERYCNKHHYDFSIAHRGFEYLIETISERDLIWPSRKLVHYQLFAQPSGASIIDWINCTATLESDLSAMAHHFGLIFRPGKPQRQGPCADYRSYYTDRLADIVIKTWNRELNLFGFDFDRPESKYTPLELAARVKAARYILRDDRMIGGTPELSALATRRPAVVRIVGPGRPAELNRAAVVG
jgi:hypothetical protein